MKKTLLFLVIQLSVWGTNAQVFTNKEHKGAPEPRDSGDVYHDALPILGRKAYAKGFDLPYSAGLSVNYLGQRSSIIIKNLMVGFNGGELYNLDNIIRFNDAVATTNGLNVRPDIWVFPFLNVYGIFAASKTSTEVDFSINVPDGTSYTEILSTNVKAEFQATTIGFRMHPNTQPQMLPLKKPMNC